MTEAGVKKPKGELLIRTLAMPADTNPSGDVFGGWLVSQMDLAAASLGYQTARGRVTTVAIDSMNFLAPLRVGDYVCCYAYILRIGQTSLSVKVESWAARVIDNLEFQVTEGIFTMVALDECGKPRPVKKSV